MGIVELAQSETKRNLKRMISEYEGIAERHNRAVKAGDVDLAVSIYDEYLDWREGIEFQREMLKQMLSYGRRPS